ncbi:MAG: magnesium transporter CorA family protein [Atopobiaceae bacterium]|nr:magnesium transporter CorA family protein [Atopobiaceae bacterium]
MIELLRTDGARTATVTDIAEWTWVRLTAPTDAEINRVAQALGGLDTDDLIAARDPEEKTRIESEEGYTLILIDVPTQEVKGDIVRYNTIPLGIIVLPHNIVTVCAEDTAVLEPFYKGLVRGFSTKNQTTFVYQIMLRCALLYQRELRIVDSKRIEYESRIDSIASEQDLVGLHELESALVYFATSLRGNAGVLSRLGRTERLRPSEAEQELLDDAIMENQQAIEMAQIYHDIIDGTRQLISSVMESRLNNVMQRLTSITLILSIPTVISGLYGMNVALEWMPLAQAAHGFTIISLITVVLCIVLAIYLYRKRML